MTEEYTDMLFEGNHKLTKNEVHAWAKATRKRVLEAKKYAARQKSRTFNKDYKMKPYTEPL